MPPKVMCQASWATCGLDITVPFEPGGSRPRFCKDCLRDYQRATAKAKNEIARKNTSSSSQGGSPHQGAQQERTRVSQSYASKESPLSLAQAQHIEPKKFKSLRQRPNIDLSEVQTLIDDTRRSE